MTAGVERLEVSRVIKASPETVFTAWTDPKLIVQWWGAGGVSCTAAEMNLAVGGEYRIANQTPDGTTMWITGTFSKVEPPHLLEYSWAMEPVDPETAFSLVAVSFSPTSDGTVVTIRHSRITDAETRETNLFGWTGCLDGLTRLVAGGTL